MRKRRPGKVLTSKKYLEANCSKQKKQPRQTGLSTFKSGQHVSAAESGERRSD